MVSKISLFVALSLVSACVYAGTNIKSIRGFQNIPWYSSVQQVKKALTNSVVVNQCEYGGDKKTEAELKRLAREDNSSCIAVINKNYSISGAKFFLDASFNSKDQLNNVNLRYFPSKEKEMPDALTECQDVYKRINSLLEIKYGDSFDVKNGGPALGFENFEMRVWVLSPTELWVRNSWGEKNPDSVFSSKCKTEINYGPRISEESDKL